MYSRGCSGHPAPCVRALTLWVLVWRQVDAPWEERWQASQVMAMEVAVLQALEWRVGAATAPDFLDRLLHVANVGRDAAGCLLDPTTAHAARNTANSLIMTALLGEPLCRARVRQL